MRVFILITLHFLTSFLGSTLSVQVSGQPVSSSLLQQKMQSACSYLKSQYNPKLGLVRGPGYVNVNFYYIAPDNLLIAKAISSCDPATSNAINQSIISCCDSGHDRMHEALFGLKIPLPITDHLTYTFAYSATGSLFRGVTPTSAGGNYTVVWEVHNSTGTIPDCTYGDVTVYTAVLLLEQRKKKRALESGGRAR